jgi:hypothetical protein
LYGPTKNKTPKPLIQTNGTHENNRNKEAEKVAGEERESKQITMENIKRINTLYKEISELKYFLTTLDSRQVIRGDGFKDILSFIKIETVTKVSIFGSRRFGCGSHKSTIQVPDSMIPEIVSLAKDRLKQLQDEYDSLFVVKENQK